MPATAVDFKNSQAMDVLLDDVDLAFRIQWLGNTTPASQAIVCTNAPLVCFPYIANGADPSSTSVDTNATFGSLTNNAAPSTCGIIVTLGNAVNATSGAMYTAPQTGRILRVVQVVVPTVSINSGTMTAGVVTLKGNNTGEFLGTTSNQNAAFIVSCTAWNASASNVNTLFEVLVRVRVLKGP